METSTTHSNESCSMLARFGKIAAALAFGILLCTFPAGSVLAARHGGGGGHHGGGGHGGYRGGEHWGGGHHWGGHWGGGYYAPGPDYWVAPEPYAYGPAPCYYAPYEEYDCGPPPNDGMNLFFHL